jgi:spermidine/putrescine-binding protein
MSREDRSSTSRRQFNQALSALGLSFVSLPMVSRPTRAAGEIMDVTWQGYDAPELMQSYIAKYGGPPEFSYIASDDETFQKVRAGFAPDLVHPGSYMINRYFDAGLVQPFDTSRLSIWPDIAPGIKDLRGSVVDGQRYFIPAEFGNSSILFRTDLVDAEYVNENSWKIIYDERYAGRLAWYDSADATVQVAALMLGYDNIYSLGDDQLKEISGLMQKQRDVTRFYWSDVTEMEQAVASGEVVAAYAWNQSLVNLMKQGLPVAYMVPKEGIFAWGSGFVMHKDCKNLDAAYDYINSWISPESGAWMIDNYGYGSANLKAYDLVAPARLAELGFTDPEGMLAQTIFFEALAPEFEQKYQALYEEIRAGG